VRGWLAAIQRLVGLRTRLRRLRYRRRWGFFPPPRWSDISGYETLLEAIRRHHIAAVDGDVVEIGAFIGGGTYKLCKLFEREAPEKRIFAVDVFDPTFDVSPAYGVTQADLYEDTLHGRNQRSIYDEVTASCRNLTTIAGDSAQLELPTDEIAYAHIDGNHDPAYVRGDFELVWPAVSGGGIVSFDDYGQDLQHVTEAINRLVEDHRNDIEETWAGGEKTLFVKKRAGAQRRIEP
jgi:Methyltransferase domain